MVDIVILGSGTPNPDPDRAGAAVAVVGDRDWVLVDCGRGATLRAIAAGLDLRQLVTVFITHHHSDHVSDLPTLALARWSAGATAALRVVAPTGRASSYARHCLDAFDDECFWAQAPEACGARPQIVVDEFDASTRVTGVLEGSGWSVRSVLVDHHPVAPAVGYRITRDGVAVVVSGDTAVCDTMYALADGADVVVHEALLTARASAALLAWNAGATSVGRLAATVQPTTLVLTHLIPAPASIEDETAYVDEVRAGGFTGPTLVARDLLRFTVEKR